MVGCGRCDDWFHGECVGLDLDKVQQMEQEDQEYVCLRCCEEEDSSRAEPGVSDTPTKDQTPKNNSQQTPRQKQGQGVTTGGVRPFRKVRPSLASWMYGEEALAKSQCSSLTLNSQRLN